MTFRTGKRHKVQESGKSTKNVLKLASRLQRFLNTGKASKQDLEDIDAQFVTFVSERGEKILRLLDQLQVGMQKTKRRDSVNQIYERWSKWLAQLDTEDFQGYSTVRRTRIDAQNTLLESAVDAESDLLEMLNVFDISIAAFVRKSSYELPDVEEISKSAEEILEKYELRQRILSKAAGET